jgi:hypothetical protein
MAVDRSDLPPLVRLLVDLAIPANSELLQQFLRDPRAVMTEYGLTNREQSIVLSGNLEAIRRALDKALRDSGAQLPSGSSAAIVVTWAAPEEREIIIWDM